MPTADLLRRIRLGEDSALELKSVEAVPGRVSTPGRDELADELAAFANGRGGCRSSACTTRRDRFGAFR